MLAPLPPAALRLDPATVAGLERVGLRRIGDLLDRPRGPLARRWGAVLLRRLDQALGRAAEPIAPRRPPAAHEARLAFAEPIAETAAIAVALDRLLGDLCAGLAGAGRGARRVALCLFVIDGGTRLVTVGTSRPVAAPAPLARLFADRLDGLDAGAGVEAMALAATATDPLPAWQPGLLDDGPPAGAIADLVDRLANRLGPERVLRLGPRASHQPDRAVARLPAVESHPAAGWPATPPRPVRLFAPPVPIEAMAVVPDGPPLLFRWRGRAHPVARASGPERIADEWWRERRPARDYWRVEDAAGARFWLYREGLYRDDGDDGAPRWFLHGLFG